MEITVIDDSDYVGWTAAATRIGEIYMSDVKTMVVNVSAQAGSKKIDRLNILDHGNKIGLEIGNDWITTGSLSSFRRDLARLRPLFNPTGFVHLQHCQIGNNSSLLIALAGVFGVDVYGGTGNHNPVYRFNFGNYNKATPKGTFHLNVGRP